MKAIEYIKSKQRSWAKNKGKALSGGQDNKGEENYLSSVDENLFEPMLDAVKLQFSAGDGNELAKTGNVKAKMQAVHSSSALGVNVFHHWLKTGEITKIAWACGCCSLNNAYQKTLEFEKKYPILENTRKVPNVDVVIQETKNKKVIDYAIECKFSEAYASHRADEKVLKGIKKKYLAGSIDYIWDHIPNLHKLAKDISPSDDLYTHFHKAQLIKHILGLMKSKKNDKKAFKLRYLYYPAPEAEGSKHYIDIKAFAECCESDGVDFKAITYQEVIMKLDAKFRGSHSNYIKYITERYY